MPWSVVLIPVSVASPKAAPATATLPRHSDVSLRLEMAVFVTRAGFWRVGKVLWTALEFSGVLEKTFLARCGAMTTRKRLFWRAGELLRLPKDFFGVLEGYGAPEKTFLGRCRTPTARKSLFRRAGGQIGDGKDPDSRISTPEVVLQQTIQ